ncbi:serine hydrolase [Microbacterium sp. ZXX196]|uniref:serine hydrolase domain-containing protein n=1 Tax=Microbacterium sp. ZXX196 TaxID=2609291 RepID=UPI0012B702C4|nr:serine hydrolase domain-containing protein [Microbacterium sp. ZXX196]MTE24543.1 serine hydrolase [Microbacterium sp. ZXX196]
MRRAWVAGIVVAALGLAGCQASSAAVELGEAPPADAVRVAPDAVDDAVSQLPDIVRAALEESGVPGAAVAVVHGGEVVLAEGFGVRDLRTGEPVTADTVFPIASMSKPLSATAVALAIEEDPDLSWDTRLVDLDPGFALADPRGTADATLGDAFSHQLGLPTGAGDDLEDVGFGRDDILARLEQVPVTGLRAGYAYSNFGFTWGAEGVATRRGQDWADVVDELVFDPLGMGSSSARHADYLGRADRAVLHEIVDGAFRAGPDRDADAQAPAGGVSSNVRDLASWVSFLLATEPGGALAEAMSAQVVRGAGLGERAATYGYGFNVDTLAGGRVAVSHSGGFVLGAATNVQLIPSLDVGIVTLTNGAPVGVPEAVNAAFADVLQFGGETREWTAAYAGAMAPLTAPVGDLVGAARPAGGAPAPDDLAGTYTNAYFGAVTVRRAGDGYVAEVGPSGVELALEPWDGPVLAYAPRGENAPDGSLASATFADGSVRFDTLDAHGLGTFSRDDGS